MAKKKTVVVPPRTGKKASFFSLFSSNNNNNNNPHEPLPNYKEGRQRSYFSTSVPQEYRQLISTTKLDLVFTGLLVLVSLATKLPSIGEPHVVVFDEVHIVMHINKYIDGVYFNDVTPPLSKLFYTFIAYLMGYRGQSPISLPGSDYTLTTFPYIALRVATVVLGTGVVPLLYWTLRLSGVRSLISFATSLLWCFENTAVLHSRLFMPDTLFVLGVALAVYSYKKFDVEKPFGKEWIRYLLLTGISLGLTVSTKWIGLATVGWVVILSVVKMWYIIGDLQVSDVQIRNHALLKTTFFIILPALIYFGTFVLHILLLVQYHNDASLLSTDYQRSLIGHEFYFLPKYVTYGSTVTIRHDASMGGYLHSHEYPYKSGSGNQQVTVFDFKDYNNEWIIEPKSGYNERDPRIRSNVEVKLRHKNTGALLRVTDFKPPISEQEYDSEVCTFGNYSYQGNDTDIFWLKFIKKGPEQYLTTNDMRFTLFNSKQRCTVLSHDLKLPDWGFNQQEVICIQSPTESRALFYIENIKYPEDFNYELVDGIFQTKAPLRSVPIWEKFWELNTKMIRLFQSIKSGGNKKATDPLTWPWLTSGLRYSSRPDSSLYVIGNPVTFWLTLILIPVFCIVKFVELFRVDHVVESINYKSQALSYILGWGLHYLPYIFLEGEYFVQYYLPALYFGVLLIGVTFEFLTVRNKNLGRIIVVLSVVFAYYFFSSVIPVIFGTKWTKEECQGARFLDGWDFRCDTYTS